MQVREYTDDDLEHIKALHARSGFGYAFPDVSRAEFFSRRVVRDEDGIAMASFLKLSAEAFFVRDPDWRTPAWRIEALRQLHSVCYEDAAKRGVASVNAFLVPEICKSFGRRLKKLGWDYYKDDEWRCFSHEVTCG